MISRRFFKTRDIFKIFLFMLILLVGLTFAQEQEKVSEYHLGVNDLLEIVVYQEPDLSKTTRVAPDGTISFPLLGVIYVKGLTAKELETKITELLRKDYLVNPQVSVFIREYSKISVLGQVRFPGSYELKAGLTVIDAIALAGGFTPDANIEDVKLIRTINNEKKTIEINAKEIIEEGRKEKDIVLEPGDLLVVGEFSKEGEFVILGQVAKPGKYILKKGMTVIEGIAEAGGLTAFAAANKTKVIRVFEGKKQIITIPVSSILEGKEQNRNIILQPNDTIVVPESFF